MENNIQEQELDLSFVQVKGQNNPNNKESDELDLSFLDEIDPTRPVDDNRGTFRKLADTLTGENKQTEAIEGLKEFDVPTHFILTRPLDMFKTSLGLLTTFDPLEQVQILKKNFPKLKFQEDEKGNIIVDGTEEGAGIGVLNAPGVSFRDLRQLGFQMAAFTPAGRAASTTGGVSVNALKVGGASAATQAGQDVISQSTGRTDEVSLQNINQSDVVMAGGLGGSVQAGMQVLAKMIPVVREQVKATGGVITEETKELIRNTAIKFGLNADDVTDELIKEVAEQAENAITPNEALALRGEKEFAIPLTQGQRSLDDGALALEDSLRTGTHGETAQRIIRDFEVNQQQPAINQAKNNIAETLSDGVAATEAEAGGLLKESIRAAERTADDAVGAAYESIGDASLKPEAFRDLLDVTRDAIKGMEFVKDPSLTKATAGLMKKIDDFDEVLESIPDGVTLKPFHIKKIEQLRKSINNFANTADNSTDSRNIVTMKRAFDDFIDDAVKNALFTGDDAAIESLKSSRELFKEYAAKFRAQPKKSGSGRTIQDKEGAFIEKIIDDNPTDEQVINALFGASNLSNVSGARMAQRFKTIIGKNSDAWKTVKLAAFQRLIKTNLVNGEEIISGQQTLKAIKNATEKNSSLIIELFTKEEIGLIRRFAAQVQRTQPQLVRSRQNPSGTAQALSQTLGRTMKKLSGILSVTGEPVLAATAGGAKMAGGLTSKSKAKTAIKPFERFINNRNASGAILGEENNRRQKN